MSVLLAFPEVIWSPTAERLGDVPGLSSSRFRSSSTALAMQTGEREKGSAIGRPGRCRTCRTPEIRSEVDGRLVSNLSPHTRRCPRCRGVKGG